MYDSKEQERRPKSWYTSTCYEYVQKECVATEVDLLKEVQGSEGKNGPSSNIRINIYSEGDVVALKHNYKK